MHRLGSAHGSLAARSRRHDVPAGTDHRYLDGGHTLDFTNKAFEALDHAGWDLAEPVLASLARGYATGDRMEESNSWRNPVDLVAILETAFEAIPEALDLARRSRLTGPIATLSCR